MPTIHFHSPSDLAPLTATWRDHDWRRMDRSPIVSVESGGFSVDLSVSEAVALRDHLSAAIADLAAYEPIRLAAGEGEMTDVIFRMARAIAEGRGRSEAELKAAGFDAGQIRRHAEAAGNFARRLVAAVRDGAPPAIDGTTLIAGYAGHDDGARDPAWTCTLDDFRAANPDFTTDDIAALVSDLAAGRGHRLGGGAAQAFTIRLAPTASSGLEDAA